MTEWLVGSGIIISIITICHRLSHRTQINGDKTLSNYRDFNSRIPLPEIYIKKILKDLFTEFAKELLRENIFVMAKYWK